MTRYYASWRFLLQKIGSETAILHIEPDFWGYAYQVNSNPQLIASQVASVNATDCAGLDNTLAGFGRCLVAMTRKYAPNAKVGLHASAWGTSYDCFKNTNASFDVTGEARKLGAFLTAVGAAEGDFVAVDALDRDADYYRLVGGSDPTWDATNGKLPHFHQAFAWATALAESVGKPILWWQLPLGNSGQSNSCPSNTGFNSGRGGYKDNRVDYFFAHTDELAKAHSIGFAFGAGAGCQTTAESDGGNLVAKMKAYAQSGGQPLCR
jgi:hypothetical protein